MKLLRSIGIIIVFILIGVVVFYFWASAPYQTREDYTVLKTYNSSPAIPLDTLTVMTYNIGYLSGMKNNRPVEMPESLFQSNLTAAKTLIYQLGPDIIGFQEIDFGGKRSYYQHQLDSLSTHGKYFQSYQSVNWNKKYVPFPYWPLKYHFGEMLSGQAILSHYPIEESKTLILEKPINAPFYYNRFYLDRLIQIAELRVGDRSLIILNLHLEAFDQETREAQALKVKEVYQAYAQSFPVLLMGDFNDLPPWEAAAGNVLNKIFEDGNIRSAITKEQYDTAPHKQYTFDSSIPFKMIDFILYNPSHIERVDARVVQEAGEISDHLPVMMKFTFKTENRSTVTE